MIRILQLLIFSLLISCDDSQKEHSALTNQHLNIDYTIEDFGNQHLFNWEKDTSINCPKNNSNVIVFNRRESDSILNNCNCTFNNGLLNIIISNCGGWVFEKVDIKIDSSKFFASYSHAGDIQANTFKAYPITQRLKLNSNRFQLGDTLKGQIDFEGIVFTDLLQGTNNYRVKLSGGFTCKITKRDNSKNIQN